MKFNKGLPFFASLIIAVIIIAACSPAQVTPSVKSSLPNTQQPAAQESTQASSSTSSTSNSADACTLLTQDDVSKVLGATVLTAESSGLGGVCTYKTTNLKVDFTLSHTGGIKAMNTTLSNLGDLALVVPGLGDQAFYNTNSASALFLLKGDAEYLFGMSDLNYQPLDPAFIQTTEKALAEQLLTNLSK